MCVSQSNRNLTDAPSSLRAYWPAILSISLGAFALVTAELLPASLLTPIAAELGVTSGLTGQAITVTAIIAAIAGPLIVILTSRFNRRHTILGLTTIHIASTICAASASDLLLLLVSRFLLGVALGGFWAMSGALTMRLVPDRLLPRAMALVNTGILAALVCSGPIGTWIGEYWNWRTAFIVTGVISAASLLAQFSYVPSLPPTGRTSLRTFTVLLRRKQIRFALVMIGLIVSAHFAGFTYVRPFLEEVATMNADAVSILLLAFGLGGLLGNLMGGHIARSNGLYSVTFSAVLIGATVAILAIFGGISSVATVTTIVWGFAFGALPVGLQTWMTRAAPDHAEAAGGLLLMSYQISVALGAVTGGLLVDGIGARGPIAYCAIASAFASLLAFAALFFKAGDQGRY